MRFHDRRLRWPDCRNARDLGGLATADGRRIRRHALIRSEDLGRLTAAGVAAVRSHGVCRVIDLRSDRERANAPGPFAGDPIVRHAPLIDERAERYRDPAAEPTLAKIYRGSIERNARNITAGIVALATAPPGGVVVHCSAGKDRTGMHVALALRAVDVCLDEIAADYALTGECLREQFVAELAALPDETARDALRDLQSSQPETITGMIEHVERRYGSVAGYLCRNGMTPSQLAALRERLTEE